MSTLLDLSLLDLSERLASRAVSSREAVDAALARVEAVDGRVRAFLHVDAANARAAADAADARAAAGQRRGPLDGVPIANSSMLSFPSTTAPASRSRSTSVAEYGGT